MKSIDTFVRHGIASSVMRISIDTNIIDRQLWWNVWNIIDINDTVGDYCRMIKLEFTEPYE
jgi:hypothetical protein